MYTAKPLFEHFIGNLCGLVGNLWKIYLGWWVASGKFISVGGYREIFSNLVVVGTFLYC